MYVTPVKTPIGAIFNGDVTPASVFKNTQRFN